MNSFSCSERLPNITDYLEPIMPQSIAFIDARLADYQTLIAGLPAEVEAIVIEGGNGLQQMAEALSGRVDIDAIHIFSHGASGELQLGDTPLTRANLNRYASQLEQIGQSLTEDGDLLLYGCNVGAGEAGQSFIESLARMTQAEVAASNNLTGSAALGGDWLLESVTGSIAATPMRNTAYQGLLVGNTVPVITSLAGDSVTWVNPTTALTLDLGADATVSDAELDALNSGNGDWSGASLSVQRQGAANAADVLGFNTSGALFTVSGANLQSSGNTFATFTNTGGVLTVSFTGSNLATTALVQDVLRHITYLNATPSGDSTVRFTLNDGYTAPVGLINLQPTNKSSPNGIATADVTVASDTIYVTNATDTATILTSDGVSFSEAVGIALADTTGTQTLVLKSGLGYITLAGNLAITENLTLNQAGTARLEGSILTINSGVELSFTGGASEGVYLMSQVAGAGTIINNMNPPPRILLLTSTSNTFSGDIKMLGAPSRLSRLPPLARPHWYPAAPAPIPQASRSMAARRRFPTRYALHQTPFFWWKARATSPSVARLTWAVLARRPSSTSSDPPLPSVAW